ncbi:MAG: hypothetical protein QG657_3185, partial [Acidobacteriota bacterium]|nr:hypothetical protein [Acidobacteriota bacterium]
MSSIIYHVTIDALEKENVFRINWIDRENTVHTFEQSASAIAPEEMEWLWKDQRNQLKIGEKLFYFLDGDDHLLQRALKDADKHYETLQLNITTCRETANWPFELLAQKGSFLLPKHVHLVRLIPVQESIKELPPQSRHLRLLFMACSPLDVQAELDYEQEEDGIFKAAEKLAVDMD